MNRQFLLEDSEFEEPVLGPLIRLGRRIDSMAKTVVSKFKDLSEKFASLKKKKDGYTKLVHNVRTKEAMRVFKVELIKVLKHLKPTKLKGQIIYGADDPATTGERLGYMSLLFPLYYDNIDITPDFSEARLEGDLFMKGRIRLGTIGWSVLKVIWNKNVKITIARLKKIFRMEIDMANMNIEGTLGSMFKGMDGFISSKSVVGEPVYVGDTIIIPLVDVNFGMAAGAFNKQDGNKAAGMNWSKDEPVCCSCRLRSEIRDL